MSFVDKEGKPCDKATWLALKQAADRVVAYEEITVNGKKVAVFSRYSGLAGEVFETAIDAADPSDADHEKYHGMIIDCADAATCAKEHARIVNAIKASADEVAVQAIPEADQAKATVSRTPYKVRRLAQEAADAELAARLAAEPE